MKTEITEAKKLWLKTLEPFVNAYNMIERCTGY
jgi:hypothetical protein